MPTPPASPPPSQQQQQQPQHRPTRSAGGVTSPWPTQRVPHAHFDLDRRPEDPLEDSEAAASAPNVGLELEELGPTEGRANGSGGGGGGSGGGGDGLPTPAIDLTLVSPPRPPGSNGSNGHHDKPQAAVPPFSPALVTPVEVELIPGYKRLRAFLMICVTWSATLQSCLGPFFPIHMRERFHASALEIGGIFAVLSITQSIVSPFIAAISRRLGRANTLRLGILLSIVGGFIFSVDRVWAFFLARALQGIGDGLIDNMSIALLMHHSPCLNRDVGLLEGSSSLGFLFGPLLAGLLYGAVGFRPLLLIFTAPFALLLLLACLAPQLVLPGAATHRDTREEQERELLSAGAGSNNSNALLRALRCLVATPSHLIYLSLVLLVAGALGFFDTSLAEHLAVALDVSSFQAGLLFTIQIMVYVPFSLVAAEAAIRLGEWPVILSGGLVWALAMFTIGPAPSLHVHIKSRKAALGVIASSLAVLGASETFVFIPFVPLLHAHLRGPRHGWAAQDAEDAVAALWTTAFAAGQMLGPLVGGGLMDALPNVEEIGCVVAGRTEMRPAEDGGPCLSSFPWVSAVWGAVGVAAWLALVACLLCERGGAGKELVGAIARRYRRFSTMGRPPVVEEEGERGDDDESLSLPPALPSLELSAAGASTLSSYSRPSSGLGRRPVLVVTRSALGAHGRAAALMRSASGASLLSRSRHSDGLSRSRHSERSLSYSTGAASASSLPRSGASAASVLSASRHSDEVEEEEGGGGGDWDHGRCASPPPPQGQGSHPSSSRPETR